MILKELKEIKSSKKDLRNFGLLVGGVLFALGALLWWYDSPAHPYLLGIGGVLFVLGILFPKVLTPLQKVWMGIAVVMGFFMTRLILSILYYVVFTVIGLLLRLVGKKVLGGGVDKSATSYWNRWEEKEFNKEDLEKQF